MFLGSRESQKLVYLGMEDTLSFYTPTTLDRNTQELLKQVWCLFHEPTIRNLHLTECNSPEDKKRQIDSQRYATR